MAEKFAEDAPDEEDVEEAEEERREESKEAQEEEAALAEAYGYPPEVEKPSAFAFFRKVVETPDTSKVSFLNKEELGGVRLSVRDYQTLANFEQFLGHDRVSAYFQAKAEIALRTGLSREGFLMNLAVTQRKEKRMRREKEGKKGWKET